MKPVGMELENLQKKKIFSLSKLHIHGGTNCSFGRFEHQF